MVLCESGPAQSVSYGRRVVALWMSEYQPQVECQAVIHPPKWPHAQGALAQYIQPCCHIRHSGFPFDTYRESRVTVTVRTQSTVAQDAGPLVNIVEGAGIGARRPEWTRLHFLCPENN